MPRTIVVKGTSGAGKATFAAELADRLRLAYVEIDALHWSLAGARHRPRSSAQALNP